MKRHGSPLDGLIDDAAHYEVTAIRYSQRQTSTDEAFYRNKAYGEPGRSLDMAFYFWVVQGSEGTLLFDTGFSSDSAQQRSLTFLREPLVALADMGIKPKDVDAVFLSHLHFDHTGHADCFPNAQVFVDQLEFDFWTSGYGRKRAFEVVAARSDLEALHEMKKTGQLQLLDGSMPVRPGVVSIRVGGHTPGQHILSVKTKEGVVVLASDALHFYDEMNLDRPFVLFTDVEDMFRGYELLRTFEQSGAKVVAGHDMQVMDRFRASDESPFATSIR